VKFFPSGLHLRHQELVCDQLLWFSQILSLLPPYEGKDVIELGAGIGRFTGELAKTAGRVVAMDFMDNLIKKVLLTDGSWQLHPGAIRIV